MKKLICSVMVIALVAISLVGCGSSNNGSSDSSMVTK